MLGDTAHRISLDGVVGHRSGVIEEGDVIIRYGMRCTSPLRTVIDLSGPMTVAELGKVVDDFLRRKLLGFEELRARSIAPDRHQGVQLPRCVRYLPSGCRDTTRAKVSWKGGLPGSSTLTDCRVRRSNTG